MQLLDLERPTSKVLQDLEKIREKQGFDPKDFGLMTDFAALDGLLTSVKSPDKGSSKEDDDR